MLRRRSILAFALLASLLVMMALPAEASHAAIISENSSATELGNGTLTNGEIERSGEPGFVGHDLARSNATARWAFDYGSGSTAYDHVGSNDGAISGATWTSGISGQALDFDGSNDNVDLDNPDTVSSFAVGGWVNYDTSGSGSLIFQDAVNNNIEVRLNSSGHFRTTVRDSGGSLHEVVDPDPAASGTWYHVMAVWNGSTLFLYKNGSIVDTTPFDSMYTGFSDDTAIGSNSVGTGGYFDGAIDEFRFYDEALSPGQVNRLTDAPNTKLSANATERWALDANTGTTVFGDEGNDGSFNGDPQWVSGQSGTALDFDGTGDEVVVSHSGALDIDTSLTITGWIKTTTTGTDYVYRNDIASGGASKTWLRMNSGVVEARYNDGADTLTLTSGSVNDGNWHHIAFTVDFSTSDAYLYVNGTQVDSNTSIGVTQTSGVDEIHLGSADGSSYYTGSLDDVHRYDRSLAAGEVEYLYDHPGAQLNETSSYEATHSVENSVSGYADLELANAKAIVTYTDSGGSTLATNTYTSTGNHTQSWSQSSSTSVDVNVTFVATGTNPTARLHDEGVSAQTYDPVTNDSTASPNSTTDSVDALPVTLSVNITDADFPTEQGDSVTAEFFVNGSSVGSDTATSNGTVSTSASPAAGNQTWYVNLSDSYGNTYHSRDYDLFTPSTLFLREETNPDQLVDGVTVKITAYYSDEVQTRNVSDGSFNLTGFPVDGPLIIRANATNYTTRTAVIESIFDQNSMYLLNDSVGTYLVRFDLEDPTGNYPRDDTVLFVERDLNKSGEVEWRTIAGDNFGVKGVPVYLKQDERYRLRIKNLETSDTVVVGAYTAIQSETVTVSAGSAVVDVPLSERAYGWNVTENETAPNILVQYNDTEDQTESIKITIHERFNKSNVLVDNNTFSTSNLLFQQSLTSDQANKTWMAELYIDRGDGYMHFRVPISSGPTSLIPVNLDSVWVQAIGVFIMLVVSLAFSQLNQGVGAVTTSLVGGLLWFIGLLSGVATGAAIVIAIGISVVFHYQHQGGAA